MFNEYEKDGRIIHATSFAYEAIYKAQGYKPLIDPYSIFNLPNFTPSTGGDENVMFTFDVETAPELSAPENVPTAGSGNTNSGVGSGTTAGKSKRKSK